SARRAARGATRVNPFDLRGPQFLLFYAALIVATSLLLLILRLVFESGPVPKLPSVDPYLVACLRGGPREAIRVATLALVDRGLIKVKSERLVAADGALAQVRRPLERAIVAMVRTPRAAWALLSERDVLARAESLKQELIAQGLLPNSMDSLRRMVFLAA